MNLLSVFRELGSEAPEWLFEPILKRDRRVSTKLAIRGFINPKIDGLVTSYYEWYQGAELDVGKSGGSMHKSDSLLLTCHLGFNRDNLFIRMDPRGTFRDFQDGTEFSIVVSKPAERRITCPLKGEQIKGVLFGKTDGDWKPTGEITDVAVRDILEMGIPFRLLGAVERDEIHLVVSLNRNGEEIERCPWRGHFSLVVPTENFEAMMWY